LGLEYLKVKMGMKELESCSRVLGVEGAVGGFGMP
jgi:hypothetical protein